MSHAKVIMKSPLAEGNKHQCIPPSPHSSLPLPIPLSFSFSHQVCNKVPTDKLGLSLPLPSADLALRFHFSLLQHPDYQDDTMVCWEESDTSRGCLLPWPPPVFP